MTKKGWAWWTSKLGRKLWRVCPIVRHLVWPYAFINPHPHLCCPLSFPHQIGPTTPDAAYASQWERNRNLPQDVRRGDNFQLHRGQARPPADGRGALVGARSILRCPPRHAQRHRQSLPRKDPSEAKEATQQGWYEHDLGDFAIFLPTCVYVECSADWVCSRLK